MTTPIDLNALKTRQQTAWASGDYAVVGTTLQIVGEELAKACDLRWDQEVLDVAAGNGNATLAAARRGCKVTSTDYVSSLLERGAERARAEGLNAKFQVADAEILPFADNSFDAVLSTFGVMFTPDHSKAAAELARVCRPGGGHWPCQLDARQLYWSGLQDPWPLHRAACRGSIARTLGHRRTSSPAVW